MSIANIKDLPTRTQFRNHDERVRRLESQISQVVTNSTNTTQHSTLQGLDYASAGHTGFATSASVSAITGTISVGTATPSDGAATPIWVDTTGGAAAYRLKFWNGSTWVEWIEG